MWRSNDTDALTAPQVVVVDSAATRVAAGNARGIEVFAQDMPGNVPLQRWDQENAILARLGGRAPIRFAAFMQGMCIVTFLLWTSACS